MTLTVVCLETGREHLQDPKICEVVSNTILHCPTPAIADISSIQCLSGFVSRRRRDASQELSSGGADAITDVVDDHVINKRQTSVTYINNDLRQFYIGIILDGVPTYRNVTEALGKQWSHHVNCSCTKLL